MFCQEFVKLYLNTKLIHLGGKNHNTASSYIKSDGSINNIGRYTGISVYLNNLFQDISGQTKHRLDHYQTNINTSPITITYDIFDISTLNKFISEYIEQRICVQHMYFWGDESPDLYCIYDCAAKFAIEIMIYAYDLMRNDSNPTKEKMTSIKKDLHDILSFVFRFYSKLNMQQLNELYNDSNLKLQNLKDNIIKHLSPQSLWINLTVKEICEKQLRHYKLLIDENVLNKDPSEAVDIAVEEYNLNLPSEIKQSDPNTQKEYLSLLFNSCLAFERTILYSVLYLFSNNNIRCQLNYKGYKLYMQQIDVLLEHDILVNHKGKNAIINFIVNVINNTEQEIESFHATKSKKK